VFAIFRMADGRGATRKSLQVRSRFNKARERVLGATYDENVLRLAFAVLAVSVLFTDHSDAQTRPHITGFFTNMQYIGDAGDVLGMEVWIVYARGSYWATVQLAEGEPEPPVVVLLQVSGQRISFALPAPMTGSENDGHGNPIRFDGEVNRAELKGKFGRDEVRLKRGTSYWQ
jgi:hypothetical protein